jgi:hypothetical protein
MGLQKLKPALEVAITALLATYRSNAKRRRNPFCLSREKFRELVLANCYYCGSAPNMQKTVIHRGEKFFLNGIDRKINSEGYTNDNTVSCCSACNYLKKSMDAADFIYHVNFIAKNHPLSLQEQQPIKPPLYTPFYRTTLSRIAALQ